MDTAVEADFGDGRYRFWLPMKQIIEIERLCDNRSILTIHDELGGAMGRLPDAPEPVFVGGGDGRIRDIYEVIRCAVIGGGNRIDGETEAKVSPTDATAS